jgi:chromosome segregation ATPase
MLFQTKRYQVLLERVDVAERRLADLAEQQRQFHEALTQQQTDAEQEGAALREIVERQYSQHESLVALINESHQQLDRLRDEFTVTFAQQGEQIHHRLQEVETALTEQRQAVEQLRHLLSRQIEDQANILRVRQGEIEALLERHVRDAEDALRGLRQEVAAERTAFTHRIEQIEATLEQLVSRIQALEGLTLAWQQRADTQEQQITTLRFHLQEEVQAREKLAQQVATIAGQRMPPRRGKPQA